MNFHFNYASFLLNCLSNFRRWAGFRDKTLWDFLTPMIAFATVLAAFITIYKQQQSDANRYQEEALKQYIAQIDNLLSNDKLKKEIANNKQESANKKEKKATAQQEIIKNPVQNIIRARTISTLQQLNKDRKRILINFLIATQLVNTESRPKPIISLSYANLEQVNLSGVDLSGADLSGADLTKARLNSTQLMYANLTKNANLQQTSLIRTRLREADLTGSDLNEPDPLSAYGVSFRLN